MSKTIEVILRASDGNLKTVLASSGAAVDAFGGKAEAAGKKQAALSSNMKVGLATAGTAVALGLGFAVKSAAEFDASMHNVNSLMGMSQKQLAAYSQQVIGMSTKLPQSAKNLADGLYEIASSGFEGQKGLQVLNASATAASAGLTDTETAADAIISVLHSYGESASDAGKVSDSLFQTVNLGVLSFSDLAQGIGQVVGIASTAHVSIDQVGAAIATMTRTGVVPAEAFTSLNQLITRLIKPTDALQAVYKQLGYSSGEAALQQKGLGGVMADINKVTGGSATATVTLMGDVRAARGAFALGAQGGALYSKMLKGMGESSGETGKVLAEQSKSASYQFKLLKNDVTAAGINVGTALLPYLVKGATGLQHFFQSASSGSGDLGKLGSEVMDLIQKLVQLAAGVQHGLSPLEHLALGAAIGSLTAVAHVLGQIVDVAEDHKGAVEALVVGLAGLKIAGGVSSGLSKLGGPGGALDALGARALYAKDGVSKVRGSVAEAEGAMGKLKATAGGIGGVMKSAGSGMLALAGGPVGATTLAVLAGVSAWANYESGVKSAMDAADAASKKAVSSTNFWDPKSVDQQKKALQDQSKAFDDSQKHASLWSKAMNFISVGSAEHSGDYEKAAGAAGKYTEGMEKLDTTSKRYATTAQLVGDRLGLSASAVGMLAQKAGIADSTIQAAGSGNKKAADQVTAAISKQMATSSQATSAVSGVTAALDAFQDAETTAADRAGALADAIEGLVTPGINLQTATQGWEEAMAAAVKTAAHARGDGIDPLTHAFDTSTKSGAAAAGAMNDLATGMSKTIAGMAKAGEPTSHMNEVLAETVKRFDEAGRAAGLSEPQIRAYAKTLGLTPKAVTTLIKQYGAADTKQAIAGVTHEITKVPKEVRTQANLLGADDATSKINNYARAGRGVPKTISTKASAPGADTAALQLVNVARKAAGVPALKRLPVTTPGITDSIGFLKSMRSAVINIPGHKASDIEAIDNATGVLSTILGQIASVPPSKSTTITVTERHNIVTRMITEPSRKGTSIFKTPNAYGGIWRFDGGGTLPDQAKIAPDGANLVQWAEPGTGGEAFIPLSQSRRKRSADILDQVAGMFGYDLVPLDSVPDDVATGIDQLESFANGGTRSAAYKARLKRDQLRSRAIAARHAKEQKDKERHDAYEQRLKEQHAAYLQRVADRHEQYLQNVEDQAANRRLAAPVALESSLYDPGTAVSAFQTQQEQMAQNAAQLKANRTANTHDTADDYYKAPKMMTASYEASFQAQLKNADAWSKNLSKIAQRAGAGVALQLEQMGAAGEDLVTKMANTTETQTKRMAKSLTDLAGTAHQATQDFQLQLRDSTTRSVQFNKDLMTLLTRGDVSLVAKLQGMGVDAGYQIARQAVTEPGRDKSLENDINKNNSAAADENLTKALQLAQILESGKDNIGIAGLATSSGMSIADVWTLLAQYNAQVFHKLAGKMDPIRRDQALVAAGKSISGMQDGGIVSGGAAASGLYYRWAESGTKGESLIPHDPANRNRARALWHETGRIIGSSMSGPPTKVVTVGAGAVQMKLTVNGSNMTPDQVQQIVAAQTSAAVDRLVTQLSTM